MSDRHPEHKEALIQTLETALRQVRKGHVIYLKIEWDGRHGAAPTAVDMDLINEPQTPRGEAISDITHLEAGQYLGCMFCKGPTVRPAFEESSQMWRVSCYACGAVGPRRATEADAIKAWGVTPPT